MNLSTEQQAIIDYISEPQHGPIRVLAGPGAGKTYTLVHVYDTLVEKGINPNNIVAVAFNRAMADELQERIKAKTITAVEDQITTIHALCYRLLAKEGLARRVAAGKEAFKVKMHMENAIESIEGWAGQVSWKDAVSWIYTAKADGITQINSAAYFEKKLCCVGAPLPAETAKKLSQVRYVFDKAMRDDGVMDFVDMLYEFEQLLINDPAIRTKYQSMFTHIIVDEAQDVGGQTHRIMTTLAKPQNNLIMIGDRDQTLYKFIGAMPEYLGVIFEEMYPGGKLFKLTTNYRSTKAIVETIGKVVESNYDDTNKHLKKTLQPKPDAEDGVPFIFTKEPTPYTEGNYIAEQIEAYTKDDKYKHGDIFILSRTRAYLQYIEGALATKQIPYINLRGASFWESGYVGKMLAYLRLGMNPHDDKAFEVVYNVASNDMKQPYTKGNKKEGTSISHRYLGKAFLSALKEGVPSFIADQIKSKRDVSYYDGFDYIHSHSDSWRWCAGFSDLDTLLARIIHQVKDNKQSPAKVLTFILDNSVRKHAELSEGVNQLDASEDIFEEFATVVDIAQRYDTCEEFITYIDMLIEEARKARNGEQTELVVLNTIHGSKGKERKIVFCPGWAEGILPHAKSINPTLAGSYILPVMSQGKIEDERCVAFVAISRAKEIVEITGPTDYMGKPATTSRFVGDLGLLNKSPAELLFGVKEFEGFD